MASVPPRNERENVGLLVVEVEVDTVSLTEVGGGVCC